MNRTTLWSENPNTDYIPTPPHAMDSLPSHRSSLTRDGVRLEERAATNHYYKTPLVGALIITMIFVLIMILLFYDKDFFVPVVVFGTLGSLILSFVVLNDMYAIKW